MRLNRENTMIENNLYPLAGFHPADGQKKLCEMLAPFEQDILQIQGALLLHNIPLFVQLTGVLLGFVVLSGVLASKGLPSLVYGAIFVPLWHLFYLLGGVALLRKSYLKELPKLDEKNPRRIRTLEELMKWFYMPMNWGWKIGFFIYRTFVCPNIVDTAVMIVVFIILGAIFKAINAFVVMGLLVTIFLGAPAVLAMTPAGDFVKNVLEDMEKKKNQKKEN